MNNSLGTALLVIDLQNDYCHPDGVFAQAGLRVTGLDELVGQVNGLATAARAAARPVIWVRMEWDGDADVGLLAERSPFLRTQGLRRGTWGAELLAGLDRAPDDHEVIKARFDAFHGTGLRDLLRDLGVGTLVMAGVRTDFCVESTVRQAFFHDLRVVVAREAVAGYFDDLHLNSLRLMDTVFADVVPVTDAAAALAAPAPPGAPVSPAERA
ncbi:MAG: cysteine hydrolase family protein [Spirillospora sp.]